MMKPGPYVTGGGGGFHLGGSGGGSLPFGGGEPGCGNTGESCQANSGSVCDQGHMAELPNPCEDVGYFVGSVDIYLTYDPCLPPPPP